jgi:glycosyltransferase involved in cell wall biosynthesis
MPDASINLAVCIPTYRRPQLLGQLLGDLSRQTIPIDRLIIVDGEPCSREVLETLAATPCRARELRYVPSNHANLPYQRFVGWKAAAGAKWLLYLDDDLRLLYPDSAERLIRPLRAGSGKAVGTTVEFEASPAHSNASGSAPLPAPPAATACFHDRFRVLTQFARRFGSSNGIVAGGLSPAGHRRPLIDRNKPYELVGCLRGGAMAYRMSAITPDCFCDALFAMGQRGWGLGEDTLLSHRVGARGVLLTTFRAGFVHPEGERTLAFHRAGFGRGYATAYSRRLLNDHYRGPARPHWADRLALAKSYCAHALLAWLHALSRADKRAAAFASGYTLGAFRGLLQPPTSRGLCPEIDWRADAETALSQIRELTAAPV